MRRQMVVSSSLVILCATLIATVFGQSVKADPPAKKRVIRDREPPRKSPARPAEVDRAKQPPRKAPTDARRAHRIHSTRSYVPTRRDYGHVRVTRYQRGADGRLPIRPIVVRSARVSPVVLNRFEDRRQEQIRHMIQLLRDNRRGPALEIWATFVDGLTDYREPIDLDDIMLYIAREGCFHGNDRVLFNAAKLEHLRESADRLEDYIDILEDQADACRRGVRSCSAETVRDIEVELVRVRAERKMLDIQATTLDNQFDTAIASSREYEQSFATVYEDMYREVEFRISFSP